MLRMTLEMSSNSFGSDSGIYIQCGLDDVGMQLFFAISLIFQMYFHFFCWVASHPFVVSFYIQESDTRKNSKENGTKSRKEKSSEIKPKT